MTPEKLEALRRLAADERTPEEEARTAALLYARNVPSMHPAVEQFVPKSEVDTLRAMLKQAEDRTARAEQALAVATKEAEANKRAAVYFHKVLKQVDDARKQKADAETAERKASEEARKAIEEGVPVEIEKKATKPPVYFVNNCRPYGWK
jgi:hypothetical protein